MIIVTVITSAPQVGGNRSKPKSSTLHVLASMLNNWTQATDGSGAAVRVVLFDYRKAFDFIDHNLLVCKVFNLVIPRGMALWVVDFLKQRYQRVKVSSDCYSEWEPVPADLPQGIKLGLWLFILMINDLRVSDVHGWKYVDDTTIAEIVRKGGRSNIQNSVDGVQDWSYERNM